MVALMDNDVQPMCAVNILAHHIHQDNSYPEQHHISHTDERLMAHLACWWPPRTLHCNHLRTPTDNRYYPHPFVPPAQLRPNVCATGAVLPLHHRMTTLATRRTSGTWLAVLVIAWHYSAVGGRLRGSYHKFSVHVLAQSLYSTLQLPQPVHQLFFIHSFLPRY
jgi:hypothetical protein